MGCLTPVLVLDDDKYFDAHLIQLGCCTLDSWIILVCSVIIMLARSSVDLFYLTQHEENIYHPLHHGQNVGAVEFQRQLTVIM